MQNYSDFRKSIQDFLPLNPSPPRSKKTTSKRSYTIQIRPVLRAAFSPYNRGSNTAVCSIEYDDITPDLRGFTADIRCPYEKNNDLIKALKERIDLGDQLNMTKESTNKIIKCYNISMKVASHTIGRTIIEMIARGHVQGIYSSVETLMDQYRLEKKYSNNRTIIGLVQEAKTRSFWNKITPTEQNNLDSYLKWHSQSLHMRNFVPTYDVLKYLWRKSKSADIVTSLMHPKFGSFSDKIEHIETSFVNLYRTLSEVIPNSSLPYVDDKLPIPDLSEGQCSRSDALTLASFYKIALPNIEYEFVTNIVHLSSDSANLFNRINLNNSMNICHTTMSATNEQSLKRKLSDGNQENEIQ
ncbi:unnamed protein product [Rotaria magnacalcarata]|uniref:Uncharacterized protein n=1 Tax=Rotaria magnacalcarata TaxID=392030 RepID=A0A816DTV6_9BILA|nr:unnamed protein product [Rotaria magnacalcarata]CAF1639002.1 unnamed protein product [Rotaria magnacalcarata]CAF4485827.1 unnamed protein product [Rotaria magnacalcarata]CAF4613285.1 unnamed protein product [Rotaria magnacalcarata]